MPLFARANDIAQRGLPLASVFELRQGTHDGGRHVRVSPAREQEPADIVELAAMAGIAPGIEDPAVAEVVRQDPDAYDRWCRALVEAAVKKNPNTELARAHARLRQVERGREMRIRWRRRVIASPNGRTKIPPRSSARRGRRAPARARRRAGSAARPPPDPEPDPSSEPVDSAHRRGGAR